MFPGGPWVRSWMNGPRGSEFLQAFCEPAHRQNSPTADAPSRLRDHKEDCLKFLTYLPAAATTN